MKKSFSRLFVLLLTASLWLANTPCLKADTAKLKEVSQLKTERLAAQRGTVGQFLAEDLLGDKKAELLTTFEKYVDDSANFSLTE